MASGVSLGALMHGGVFGANMDRIRDAAQHCAPITLRFGRRAAGGKDFELTFDADPTGQIQFAQQSLTWSSLGRDLTSHLKGLEGYPTRIYSDEFSKIMPYILKSFPPSLNAHIP